MKFLIAVALLMLLVVAQCASLGYAGAKDDGKVVAKPDARMTVEPENKLVEQRINAQDKMNFADERNKSTNPFYRTRESYPSEKRTMDLRIKNPIDGE